MTPRGIPIESPRISPKLLSDYEFESLLEVSSTGGMNLYIVTLEASDPLAKRTPSFEQDNQVTFVLLLIV